MSRGKSALVEILEYIPSKDAVIDHGDAPIRVNQLRINGEPILCPKGEPITVHALEFNRPPGENSDEDDLVKVTVTMFAHRVVIEQRGLEPDPEG